MLAFSIFHPLLLMVSVIANANLLSTRLNLEVFLGCVVPCILVDRTQQHG